MPGRQKCNIKSIKRIVVRHSPIDWLDGGAGFSSYTPGRILPGEMDSYGYVGRTDFLTEPAVNDILPHTKMVEEGLYRAPKTSETPYSYTTKDPALPVGPAATPIKCKPGDVLEIKYNASSVGYGLDVGSLVPYVRLGTGRSGVAWGHPNVIIKKRASFGGDSAEGIMWFVVPQGAKTGLLTVCTRRTAAEYIGERKFRRGPGATEVSRSQPIPIYVAGDSDPIHIQAFQCGITQPNRDSVTCANTEDMVGPFGALTDIGQTCTIGANPLPTQGLSKGYMGGGSYWPMGFSSRQVHYICTTAKEMIFEVGMGGHANSLAKFAVEQVGFASMMVGCLGAVGAGFAIAGLSVACHLAAIALSMPAGGGSTKLKMHRRIPGHYLGSDGGRPDVSVNDRDLTNVQFVKVYRRLKEFDYGSGIGRAGTISAFMVMDFSRMRMRCNNPLHESVAGTADDIQPHGFHDVSTGGNTWKKLNCNGQYPKVNLGAPIDVNVNGDIVNGPSHYYSLDNEQRQLDWGLTTVKLKGNPFDSAQASRDQKGHAGLPISDDDQYFGGSYANIKDHGISETEYKFFILQGLRGHVDGNDNQVEISDPFFPSNAPDSVRQVFNGGVAPLIKTIVTGDLTYGGTAYRTDYAGGGGITTCAWNDGDGCWLEESTNICHDEWGMDGNPAKGREWIYPHMRPQNDGITERFVGGMSPLDLPMRVRQAGDVGEQGGILRRPENHRDTVRQHWGTNYFWDGWYASPNVAGPLPGNIGGDRVYQAYDTFRSEGLGEAGKIYYPYFYATAIGKRDVVSSRIYTEGFKYVGRGATEWGHDARYCMNNKDALGYGGWFFGEKAESNFWAEGRNMGWRSADIRGQLLSDPVKGNPANAMQAAWDVGKLFKDDDMARHMDGVDGACGVEDDPPARSLAGHHYGGWPVNIMYTAAPFERQPGSACEENQGRFQTVWYQRTFSSRSGKASYWLERAKGMTESPDNFPLNDFAECLLNNRQPGNEGSGGWIIAEYQGASMAGWLAQRWGADWRLFGIGDEPDHEYTGIEGAEISARIGCTHHMGGCIKAVRWLDKNPDTGKDWVSEEDPNDKVWGAGDAQGQLNSLYPKTWTDSRGGSGISGSNCFKKAQSTTWIKGRIPISECRNRIVTAKAGNTIKIGAVSVADAIANPSTDQPDLNEEVDLVQFGMGGQSWFGNVRYLLQTGGSCQREVPNKGHGFEYWDAGCMPTFVKNDVNFMDIYMGNMNKYDKMRNSGKFSLTEKVDNAILIGAVSSDKSPSMKNLRIEGASPHYEYLPGEWMVFKIFPVTPGTGTPTKSPVLRNYMNRSLFLDADGGAGITQQYKLVKCNSQEGLDNGGVPCNGCLGTDGSTFYTYNVEANSWPVLGASTGKTYLNDQDPQCKKAASEGGEGGCRAACGMYPNQGSMSSASPPNGFWKLVPDGTNAGSGGTPESGFGEDGQPTPRGRSAGFVNIPYGNKGAGSKQAPKGRYTAGTLRLIGDKLGVSQEEANIMRTVAFDLPLGEEQRQHNHWFSSTGREESNSNDETHFLIRGGLENTSASNCSRSPVDILMTEKADYEWDRKSGVYLWDPDALGTKPGGKGRDPAGNVVEKKTFKYGALSAHIMSENVGSSGELIPGVALSSDIADMGKIYQRDFSLSLGEPILATRLIGIRNDTRASSGPLWKGVEYKKMPSSPSELAVGPIMWPLDLLAQYAAGSNNTPRPSSIVATWGENGPKCNVHKFPDMHTIAVQVPRGATHNFGAGGAAIPQQTNYVWVMMGTRSDTRANSWFHYYEPIPVPISVYNPANYRSENIDSIKSTGFKPRIVQMNCPDPPSANVRCNQCISRDSNGAVTGWQDMTHDTPCTQDDVDNNKCKEVGDIIFVPYTDMADCLTKNSCGATTTDGSGNVSLAPALWEWGQPITLEVFANGARDIRDPITDRVTIRGYTWSYFHNGSWVVAGDENTTPANHKRTYSIPFAYSNNQTYLGPIAGVSSGTPLKWKVKVCNEKGCVEEECGLSGIDDPATCGKCWMCYQQGFGAGITQEQLKLVAGGGNKPWPNGCDGNVPMTFPFNLIGNNQVEQAGPLRNPAQSGFPVPCNPLEEPWKTNGQCVLQKQGTTQLYGAPPGRQVVALKDFEECAEYYCKP